MIPRAKFNLFVGIVALIIGSEGMIFGTPAKWWSYLLNIAFGIYFISKSEKKYDLRKM